MCQQFLKYLFPTESGNLTMAEEELVKLVCAIDQGTSGSRLAPKQQPSPQFDGSNPPKGFRDSVHHNNYNILNVNGLSICLCV
jgi:hypothetical protein